MEIYSRECRGRSRPTLTLLTIACLLAVQSTKAVVLFGLTSVIFTEILKPCYAKSFVMASKFTDIHRRRQDDALWVLPTAFIRVIREICA